MKLQLIDVNPEQLHDDFVRHEKKFESAKAFIAKLGMFTLNKNLLSPGGAIAHF